MLSLCISFDSCDDVAVWWEEKYSTAVGIDIVGIEVTGIETVIGMEVGNKSLVLVPLVFLSGALLYPGISFLTSLYCHDGKVPMVRVLHI